jgi:hypothetical protein
MRQEIFDKWQLIERLQELAIHMRYCADCHQMSVLDCPEGADLWSKAEMPIGAIRNETAGLAQFADGKLGCPECGAYWSKVVGIRHSRHCSKADTEVKP